jgi:hypothetical protein
MSARSEVGCGRRDQMKETRKTIRTTGEVELVFEKEKPKPHGEVELVFVDEEQEPKLPACLDGVDISRLSRRQIMRIRKQIRRGEQVTLPRRSNVVEFPKRA